MWYFIIIICTCLYSNILKHLKMSLSEEPETNNNKKSTKDNWMQLL